MPYDLAPIEIGIVVAVETTGGALQALGELSPTSRALVAGIMAGAGAFALAAKLPIPTVSQQH